jgi:hypothetical protein
MDAVLDPFVGNDALPGDHSDAGAGLGVVSVSAAARIVDRAESLSIGAHGDERGEPTARAGDD